MSKLKAIAYTVLANIVFWGGLVLSLHLAPTSEAFAILAVFYVEAWLLLGLSTYGVYKFIRERL